MIPSLLSLPLFFYLAKARSTEAPSEVDLSKPKIAFFILSKFIYFIAAAYSFFLPLKLGTTWFYVGLPLTLIGLVTSWMVLIDWARTPPDKLVTRGLYRYSRHPMYVTTSLLLLGVSIASASWIFLLFTIIFMVGAVFFIGLEEQGCLEIYGKAYHEYVKRTPRWIGIPKSSKSD